ncbi:MAG: histidine--tRNA ligase [Phycisphaerales bacterium]
MTERRTSKQALQSPRGTRDFYPAEMALRKHVESAWRRVSINHGFDEIEGPTFEHLELYTVKSGEGIVSELFAFRRAGGETEYALRPEFTPTLARMYAARANSLPSPTRWFSIPSHFRAERPQRGRLREFIQWNADVIGDASPRADADIIAVAVGVLHDLGIRSSDVTVHLCHRGLIAEALSAAGVIEENVESGMMLLDRKAKLDDAEFAKQCDALALDYGSYETATERAATLINDTIASIENDTELPDAANDISGAAGEMVELCHELAARKCLHWCKFDASIVRGLAYYTGPVFEILAEGERAVAGGGRYDRLIELFGGPPTPAVGIAMGDVVLRLLLEEKGLLESGDTYQPRPDVFVIDAGERKDDARLISVLSDLRSAGLHARTTAKTTKNIGKLLSEAGKLRARFALILGGDVEAAELKNLETGEQQSIAIAAVASLLQGRS